MKCDGAGEESGGRGCSGRGSGFWDRRCALGAALWALIASWIMKNLWAWGLVGLGAGSFFMKCDGAGEESGGREKPGWQDTGQGRDVSRSSGGGEPGPGLYGRDE